MEWYFVVFLASVTFLVVQLLVSLFFGDMDIDVDHDFDMADVVSFKGAIHFILGFSTTLVSFGNDDEHTIGIGIVVGLIFVFGLYFLYKFLYMKLSQSIEYTDKIEEMDAEVYFWDVNTQTGEVFINLEGRPVLITIKNTLQEKITLVAGEKIKVSGTRNLVYKFN